MTLCKSRALARHFAAPAGVIAALALAAPANAQSAGAASHCSRLGQDFVAVAGSDSCVRLGGHVRVKLSHVPSAPMGYASIGDGVRHAAERSQPVHGASPFGWLDVFPR
jgi:hypothetical protein